MTIKTSRTYFNKTNIDNTCYKHWKLKLKEDLLMHYENKKKQNKKKKVKKEPPLAWTYSSSWGNILGFKEICSIIFETRNVVGLFCNVGLSCLLRYLAQMF